MDAAVLIRLEAVSYTHLDVYKRQVYALVKLLAKTMEEENGKVKLESC